MTKRHCDICDQVIDGTAGIFIQTGRTLDAAGSASDDGQSLDLCDACEARIFREIRRKREAKGDYELGIEMLKHLKLYREPRP